MKNQAPPQPLTPRLTIYQNPDYVLGIIEQAHNQGAMTAGSHRSVSNETAKKQRGGGIHGDAEGSATVPGTLKGGGRAGGNYDRSSEEGTSDEQMHSTEIEYTPAYQLNSARNALHDLGLIHPLESRKDASALKPGDFVEFQAAFEPNQMIALLDVLTPDLVGEIFRYRAEKNHLDTMGEARKFPAEEYKDKMALWAQEGRTKADIHAVLASSVTKALRADFRSNDTRDYYGMIGKDSEEPLTAVTVCDTEHFITADPDRILDGTFTVLGKLASPLSAKRPVLSSNKLAKRINPEALDALFGQMSAAAKGFASSDAVPSEFKDAFDLKFKAFVPGECVNVIPVAIYL